MTSDPRNPIRPGFPGRDPVTGAANRALLLELLDPILALARRNARGLAILHVRVGEIPDAAIREAADAIRDGIRDCDLIARVSQGEFAVALTEVWEPDAAVRVAHRLYRSLRSLDGGARGSHCHIGVAFFPADAADAEALLRVAEESTPPSRAIAFANAALGQEALRRAGVMRDLAEPGVMSRFELHYQPIRSLSTGAVVGAESLLRWDRSGALIPAAEFIDLAVTSGRIRAIDRWSAEQALRDLAAWRARGWQGWVSINLSSRSLLEPSLVGVVDRLVQESGAPADALVFEITEGGALAGNGVATGVLDGLRGLGARVAVDDFGTGYASFEYLCDFDPDLVKLDRTFLLRGGGGGSDRLFGALVDVAHRLGKPVVAEGVEDPAELRRSLDTGCEMAQGYFLGRPVPASTFLKRHVEAGPRPREAHRVAEAGGLGRAAIAPRA
ncbi:MAG TPA: GGDEF domain-containing phosphodiesterase [Longimicrobiales bacterium]|nr:GGDEF domain-containing phosphodiesterase [Longimicrobiales bacterium]